MGKKTFVTFLTFARAPLVFAGGACALCHAWFPQWGWIAAALGLMGLSALTDLFDGLLARRWKVTSTLGALADPLMDKVFYIATLPVAVFLAMKVGDMAHALALLTLDVVSMCRDQWVSFLRSVGTMHGADVRANWAGKLRTAAAFPILMGVYAYLGMQAQGFVPPHGVRYGLMAFEAALLFVTLLSAGIYTRGYWKFLQMAIRK